MAGPFTLGYPYNTFSVVARCARTRMFGIGIATSSIAVAARCLYAKAGVGAMATQASTDPRLGITGITLLEMGFSAPKVLAELKASDPYIEKRQLSIVDKDGRSVCHTGAENRAWCGHVNDQNFAAAANMVVGERVVKAMAERFENTPDLPLEERLLLAIEAGHDAGGEAVGEHSAGLFVVDREVFPRVDLRVDEHATAVAELRRIFELYRPLIEYFQERAVNPSIPSAEDTLRAQGRLR
ncbi:MAG: DUF1028 domain-containing protein [Candidatus Entotheonellia bacterium]